jgi:hypothetical protein
MIRALAVPPVARLLRSPAAIASVAAWALLAAAVAVMAHSDGWFHGADRVLIGPYGSLILPLLAYTIVGAVLGSRAYATSVAPLVALGASPARATLVAVGVSAAVCAAAAALLGIAIVVLAHGAGDPPRLADAAATAYAAALGGAAYAAWFSWGSAMIRRGIGRAALLVVDCIAGASDGVPSWFTPRAHLRNLLGGTPPVEFTQTASAVALVVLAIACAALTAQHARRHALASA